jgi:hypothetical protein
MILFLKPQKQNSMKKMEPSLGYSFDFMENNIGRVFANDMKRRKVACTILMQLLTWILGCQGIGVEMPETICEVSLTCNCAYTRKGKE